MEDDVDDHDSGEEDDEEEDGEDRHMSAHECSAPTALAAAMMQGLAGLEQRLVCVLRGGGAILLQAVLLVVTPAALLACTCWPLL